MAKITATSQTKFKMSGKNKPNTKEVFKARITKEAPVRLWAGKKNGECGYSPLKKGEIVSVCDALLSANNNTWYYICYKGKYGFVYGGKAESISNNALRFLKFLKTYHTYIKHNGRKFHYGWMSEVTTFQKAKNRIADGKTVGITCLVPCAWALAAMNIKRKDGHARVSGEYGSFKQHYTGGIKDKLKRISSGGPIGMTVKHAVKENLLKPGDIMAFKGRTHTFVYSGEDCIMYDGGHRCIKNGAYTGCRANYEKEKYKISEILRWRE